MLCVWYYVQDSICIFILYLAFAIPQMEIVFCVRTHHSRRKIACMCKGVKQVFNLHTHTHAVQWVCDKEPEGGLPKMMHLNASAFRFLQMHFFLPKKNNVKKKLRVWEMTMHCRNIMYDSYHDLSASVIWMWMKIVCFCSPERFFFGSVTLQVYNISALYLTLTVDFLHLFM